MSYTQEPIRFRYKPPTNDSTLITLLINPEALTLNFKKVITRTRTKTRVVSFYWGQEPVNFSYQGQTGYLWPGQTLLADAVSSTAQSISENIDVLNAQKAEAEVTIEKFFEEFATLDSAGEAERAQEKSAEIELLYDQIRAIDSTVAQFGTQLAEYSSKGFVGFGEQELLRLTGNENASHTDVLKLSPKFQLFKKLQKFYEDSRASNNLIQVLYRHYIFDGYFEAFSFTDSAKDPWNWKYSISFTILSWDEVPFTSNIEQLLVQDQPNPESQGGSFGAGF